jgi:hypothetical protein
VKGNSVSFGNTTYGGQMATIEGLKLSRSGVIKEFPDLEGNDNWKIEAVKRFKEKISSLKTEDEVCKYVISDLIKFGYVPFRKKKQGFRAEAIR